MGSAPRFPAPRCCWRRRPAAGLTAEGPDADRAVEFARRFLAFHGLPEGVRLVVHRAIPSHADLGSGTQLGLAVARALAELHGIKADVVELATRGGPGQAVGYRYLDLRLGRLHRGGGAAGWERGDRPVAGPFRYPRKLALRRGRPPRSPGAERGGRGQRVRSAAPATDREVEQVSHLVLMQLLPALVEADLPSFGDALSAVQRITVGLVRRPAGRRLRARTHRAPGGRYGGLGCRRRRPELLGAGGVRAGG